MTVGVVKMLNGHRASSGHESHSGSMFGTAPTQPPAIHFVNNVVD